MVGSLHISVDHCHGGEVWVAIHLYRHLRYRHLQDLFLQEDCLPPQRCYIWRALYGCVLQSSSSAAPMRPAPASECGERTRWMISPSIRSASSRWRLTSRLSHWVDDLRCHQHAYTNRPACKGSALRLEQKNLQTRTSVVAPIISASDICSILNHIPLPH
ncbi:hypothetical protein CALCODRAFT_201664 [Calocera cornea HHB12733]|uniref:Uncharacterized protein n=1 Tax=Calocera cornea HHB12733 TaxID=1353952 RepID=A0A165C3W7_9BASI|nr:hypothetical protein CALCODRAFT_201664 [Calocera cornea HHB12733]